MASKSKTDLTSTANLGFEAKLLLKPARELRKKQTPAEDLLWERLPDRQLCNVKFRRHHQFGDYLCDFYCHEAKLVVECDGEPHHAAKGKQHDAKRDAYLKSQGLTVLRLENQRDLDDTDAVFREIAAFLPSPGHVTGATHPAHHVLSARREHAAALRACGR